MKNKKSIAIAMSVMSAAGAVVPAFAANEVELKPVRTEVSLTQANGKKLAAVPKHELTVYLKANKDENPKVIGKNVVGGTLYYVVELDNPNSNAAVEAQPKANLEKAKEDLKKLHGYTYDGNKPRYTFGVNTIDATVTKDNNGFIVPVNSVTIVTVKDNLKDKNGNSVNPTVTYSFHGVDTKYVYTPEVEVVEKTINGADEIELNMFIYKMTQAAKNEKNDIIVQDETPANFDGYKVVVRSGDAKTVLAVITINGNRQTIANNKIDLPVNNDFTGHWAEDEIVEQMIRDGIARNGKFRPKEDITRAEFAVMVYRNYSTYIKNNYTANKNFKFKDVASKTWYTEAIEELAKRGLVNGYTDGTFNPHGKITRQEAAAILAGVKGMGETKYTDINGKEIHTDIKTNFTDDKNIAVWADESVENLTKNEIIRGYADKTFKPKNNISRAEAACIVNRSKK